MFESIMRAANHSIISTRVQKLYERIDDLNMNLQWNLRETSDLEDTIARYSENQFKYSKELKKAERELRDHRVSIARDTFKRDRLNDRREILIAKIERA